MKVRLSREDWIRHGLGALAARGASVLRAEPLADTLGVSRGSFYWHFRDVADFHRGVLDAWRRIAVERIVEEVETVGRGKPARRLPALFARAFGADRRLERAVRAWATSSALAAEGVAAVDRARLDYLERLFREAGFGAKPAGRRAWIAYGVYVGEVMGGARHAKREMAGNIRALREILSKPD